MECRRVEVLAKYLQLNECISHGSGGGGVSGHWAGDFDVPRAFHEGGRWFKAGHWLANSFVIVVKKNWRRKISMFYDCATIDSDRDVVKKIFWGRFVCFESVADCSGTITDDDMDRSIDWRRPSCQTTGNFPKFSWKFKVPFEEIGGASRDHPSPTGGTCFKLCGFYWNIPKFPNFHPNFIRTSPLLKRLAEHHVTIQVPPGGLESNFVVSAETFTFPEFSSKFQVRPLESAFEAIGGASRDHPGPTGGTCAKTASQKLAISAESLRGRQVEWKWPTHSIVWCLVGACFFYGQWNSAVTRCKCVIRQLLLANQ